MPPEKPGNPAALADAPSPPRGALERWLGPVADEIEALATGKAAAGDFGARLKRLASGEIFGDSTMFEGELIQTIERSKEAGRQGAENGDSDSD